MPTSYVDEIIVRYLMKKGYLISQGIWFQMPKEKTGKKVSGWSDIDILAVKPNESPLIIQCKSFLGTESYDKVARDVIEWFKNAMNFLENNSIYRDWLNKKIPKKILVVDYSIKKTEVELKKENIDVWHYEDILKDLLNDLKEGTEKLKNGCIGKEEDVLLRILSDMIRRQMIAKEIFKGRK